MRNKIKKLLYLFVLLICVLTGYLSFPFLNSKLHKFYDFIPEIRDISTPINSNDVAPITSKSPLYKMLDTAVKVQTNEGTGSGVVVFSEKYNDVYHSYILTNAHVVRDSSQVEIERINYFGHRTIDSIEIYIGSVISTSVEYDLSVVEIISSSKLPSAEWLTKPDYEKVCLADTIYLSACPLSNNPLITEGNIASISAQNILATAFAIFGSSGGAAYTESAKFIGIVSRISKYDQHGVDHAVPQLAYIIPVDVIAGWLKGRSLNFLFDKDLDLFHTYVDIEEVKKHF